MDEFIEAINEQIKRRGTSVPRLAVEAQITKAYLYRILSRQQTPSLEIAYRLADAAGLTLKLSRGRS